MDSITVEWEIIGDKINIKSINRGSGRDSENIYIKE
jgi:hypothetical protein